jgi:hypothetical protein
MERAYSPYLSRYSVPGALPQAGMERAFRRSFWYTDGIFIYAESAVAAIPVVYQMEIRVRSRASRPHSKAPRSLRDPDLQSTLTEIDLLCRPATPAAYLGVYHPVRLAQHSARGSFHQLIPDGEQRTIFELGGTRIAQIGRCAVSR